VICGIAVLTIGFFIGHSVASRWVGYVAAGRREDYGALVTHVVDPAGVLLHFAQMDKR
jgi:hypothetical protein